MRPRRRSSWAILLAAAVACASASSCARPYAGPKTLAAIAAGLLTVGGAAWVMGERSGPRGLITVGAAGTALGAAGVVGAGGWLAASISCSADPDCPPGEECKEIPAPPGGVPYKQCTKR